MRLIKAFLRFLISRRLWTFIGVVLLCGLIWLYGPLVSVGDAAPLASELARLVAIGAVVLVWLFSILIGQLRAARANRAFVTELARPAPQAAPQKPGEAGVADLGTKFQSVLADLKRSKVGHRHLLRDMPWYVFIGPPGTGKTTALRQSGLRFPIDLSDDLKGVGGTRNCDWFFTDDAVLLDTAGRYTEQASHAEADAAEWLGFLDLLKKHRGRRALNGVIVAVSTRELLGPAEELRSHGRLIRKRLAELRERLAMQLPVYLMVTKLDLLPGFEAFFADLTQEEREQVWGATLPVDGRPDGALVEAELRGLGARAEARLASRLSEDVPLSERAEVFRFPAQLLRLEAPLRSLVEAVFGETRYDDASWLRGLYLTSATQEGSPIDRMAAEMAGAFGLAAVAPPVRRHGEKRSYFLRRLLTDVVFREAGLGTFEPAVEERRKWAWRGVLAGSVLAATLLATAFAFSFARSSGALAEQERRLVALQERLAPVAALQAPTDALDLDVALDAVAQVEAAGVEVPFHPLALLGPSASGQLGQVRRIMAQGAQADLLLPRMVALLEATMWRQVGDEDFMLDALKAYLMLTRTAPPDQDFLAEWWANELRPPAAPIDPFPSDEALFRQLDALRLIPEGDRIEPDPELIAASLATVCRIPLARRAYSALLANPAVTALDEWSPSEVVGANGPTVLRRLSERTLRDGLSGAYTFDGFHDVVGPLIPEIAAEAAIDGLLFADGCEEGEQATAAEIERAVQTLYEQDYIAQWDGFLQDIRLAPLTSLAVANANLKDLASEDSALKNLLRAVVAETDLTRVVEEAAAEGGGPPPGLVSRAVKKLGTLGRLFTRAARVAPRPGGDEADEGPPGGAAVAARFLPIKALVEEVDGNPPLLTDTVAALSALSLELQTVSQSPDPEQALIDRGTLPPMLGAVAAVAEGLPPPVNAWIAGIATEVNVETRDLIVEQLNAQLRADVVPFCGTAVAGRYPFDESSAFDVTVADFQRVFGPGGIMDAFTNDHLAAHVDMASRPWQWRADYGLPNESLIPFARARAIRDALFPGGQGPALSFLLEAKDLSPNAGRVTLNVDGQVLTYTNAATQPVPMTWPGPDRTNTVRLTFAPLDGSTEVIDSEPGSWAILRLFRKGSLSPTDRPELFRLALSNGPFSAQFDLTAASVDNPFDLSMFAGFACPERI